MLAIFVGLKTFAKDKTYTHSRVLCENTTAVNIVNHMGTSHSETCHLLAKEIWTWCIGRAMWLSVAPIPGKQNFVADFELRRNQRESEWKLDSQSLSYALSKLNFRPDIDLFASQINYQFPKFVSFRPDPSAYALCISTFQCYSRCTEQNPKRRSTGNLFDTRLAFPGVASQSITNVETGTSASEGKEGSVQVTKQPTRNTPNLAQTESTCLSLIREGLAKYQLSSSAKDVLLASWGRGTSKPYQTYLGKW